MKQLSLMDIIKNKRTVSFTFLILTFFGTNSLSFANIQSNVYLKWEAKIEPRICINDSITNTIDISNIDKESCKITLTQNSGQISFNI